MTNGAQWPMATIVHMELLLLGDKEILFFPYKPYAGHPRFHRFRAMGSLQFILECSIKNTALSYGISALFPTRHFARELMVVSWKCQLCSHAIK